MLFSFEELRGYQIRAADGEIGSVDDVLFEDTTSRVRYLVVETGSWLFGRKVLLAAAALGPVDHAARAITTGLTTRQVKDSPSVDADQPVSRQQEEALHSYYEWPPYWYGAPALGLAPYWGGVGLAPPPPADNPVEREVAEMERQQADPHLRSAREVTGYYVAASDGDIGHVEDLVIDDANWMICHLVIDTRNWLPGRKVLVDTDRLRSVDWAERHIVLEMSRRDVESSPEFDRSLLAARG
jgi:sporulation protein YlmC with PRC-barrel domain